VRLAGIKAGEKVLDACCGTGALTYEIAEKLGEKGEVIGVDLSVESLAMAQRKKKNGLPVSFRLANCAALPFPDGYFDKVCISFGMHEITDAEKLKSLREFNRVLKKEGAFLVMDFNSPDRLLPRLALKLFMRLFEDEAARRMVFGKSLLPQIQQAGFTLVDSRLMGAGIIQVLRARRE
jgi:demethylmenaquinone methyltransferase/2-methoxy-6-polyprenyl-1,4-benzoquinol methylase